MDPSQRSALLRGVRELKKPFKAHAAPPTSKPALVVQQQAPNPASSAVVRESTPPVRNAPPPSSARMHGDLGEPTAHIMPSAAIQRIRENDPSLKHLILSQGPTFQMKSIEVGLVVVLVAAAAVACVF
jgi:hypothetical protein